MSGEQKHQTVGDAQMNMNHLIKMFTRIVMAKVLHMGINKGMDMAGKAKRGKTRHIADDSGHVHEDDAPQMSQQERQKMRQARRAARQARQGTKVAGRITRM